MDKSPDAFRTISEVADWLGVPTHVLRFWESRFSQVKPVKRAGGRRYYRPADMLLLGGIKRLLHDDGLTIRGVQKMLREDGVRHVSSYSQQLDAPGPMRDVTEDIPPSPMAVDVEPEPENNVIPLAAAGDDDGAPAGDVTEGDTEALDGRDALVFEAGGEDEPAFDPDVAAHGDAAESEWEPPRESAEPGLERPEEPADVAEPEPDAEPEPEDRMPELSFLRRSAAPPPASAPQDDLFAGSGPAAPERPEAAERRPIVVPGVAPHDAADDDPSTPASPGIAARLATARLRPDPAAIARVVDDLRALRARL